MVRLRTVPLALLLAVACQGGYGVSPPPPPSSTTPSSTSATDGVFPRQGRTDHVDGPFVLEVIECSLPPLDEVPAFERPHVAGSGSDVDGDGVAAPSDCDDHDPTVHPGAEERCDGVDTDCDPLTGEAGLVTSADYNGPDLHDALRTATGIVSVCEGVWTGPFAFADSVHLQGRNPGVVLTNSPGHPAVFLPNNRGAAASVSDVTLQAVAPYKTSTTYGYYEPDPLLEPGECNSLRLERVNVVDVSDDVPLVDGLRSHLMVVDSTLTADTVRAEVRLGALTLDGVDVVGDTVELGVSRSPEPVAWSDVHVDARVASVGFTDAKVEVDGLTGRVSLGTLNAVLTLRRSDIDQGVRLNRSHVVADADTVVRGAEGEPVLEMVEVSSWSGGSLVGQVDPAEPLPSYALSSGFGGNLRVFDTLVSGSFADGTAIQDDYPSHYTPVVFDSFFDLPAGEDVAHAGGRAFLRHVTTQAPPLGTTAPSNPDGTWTLDCTAGSCAVPEGPAGVIETRLPATAPLVPPHFDPLFHPRPLQATDRHVFNPNTGELLHRATESDRFTVVPLDGPSPWHAVALEGDTFTYQSVMSPGTVSVATFDGVRWTHQPEADCLLRPAGVPVVVRSGDQLVATGAVGEDAYAGASYYDAGIDLYTLDPAGGCAWEERLGARGVDRMVATEDWLVVEGGSIQVYERTAGGWQEGVALASMASWFETGQGGPFIDGDELWWARPFQGVTRYDLATGAILDGGSDPVGGGAWGLGVRLGGGPRWPRAASTSTATLKTPVRWRSTTPPPGRSWAPCTRPFAPPARGWGRGSSAPGRPTTWCAPRSNASC